MEFLFNQCRHGISAEPVFIIEFLLNHCRHSLTCVVMEFLLNHCRDESSVESVYLTAVGAPHAFFLSFFFLIL